MTQLHLLLLLVQLKVPIRGVKSVCRLQQLRGGNNREDADTSTHAPFAQQLMVRAHAYLHAAFVLPLQVSTPGVLRQPLLRFGPADERIEGLQGR